MIAAPLDDLTWQRLVRRFTPGSNRRAIAEILLDAEDGILQSEVADQARCSRSAVNDVWRILHHELHVDIRRESVPVPRVGGLATKYYLARATRRPTHLAVITESPLHSVKEAA